MGKFYISAPVNEVALARAVAPYVHQLGGGIPDGAALSSIAEARNLDFATMLLYQALHASPDHKQFIRTLDGIEIANAYPRRNAKIFIIPALFHAHYPETGADAALAAEIAGACGFDVSTAPVKSVGTVTENAHIIRNHLDQETAENLWVFAVSKGSADFRAFMQLFPQHSAIGRIRGWVNICGLANGCQITDYNLGTRWRRIKYRLICQLLGAKFELMQEMSTAHRYWRNPLTLPANMRIFNFMAIPLGCHIQKSLIGRYLAISALGPNDGMVLCRDSIIEGGPVYPVWGCDHFFRGPQVAPLLYRLFSHLGDLTCESTR